MEAASEFQSVIGNISHRLRPFLEKLPLSIKSSAEEIRIRVGLPLALTIKGKSRDTKESYITVKSADGGEKALIVAEYMPQVKGVAIICEGGDNEIIKEKIESAVMAALDITSKRVYIAGGNIK